MPKVGPAVNFLNAQWAFLSRLQGIYRYCNPPPEERRTILQDILDTVVTETDAVLTSWRIATLKPPLEYPMNIQKIAFQQCIAILLTFSIQFETCRPASNFPVVKVLQISRQLAEISVNSTNTAVDEENINHVIPTIQQMFENSIFPEVGTKGYTEAIRKPSFCA